MVERIIEAARVVLLERGYDGASTNRIAAAAGISPGSLYQYFPDKDTILTEVVARYTDQLHTRISRAFLGTIGSGSPAEMVRRNVTALIDAFEENPDLLRVVVEQLPHAVDFRRKTFARHIDELVATVLTSRQAVQPARPAEPVAWVLVRAVEHVTTRFVLERPPISREAVIDELTELVTGYLAGLLRPAQAGPALSAGSSA